MEQKGRAEILLEGLKTRVADAPSAAFNSDKAVLDRQELLRIIENVSEVVKNELETYRETNDKKARIIEDAKAQAEEILYRAEKTASRIRVSKRRGDEPPSFRASDLGKEEKQALRTASDIYAASLIYTDEMLTEVDHLVMESYEKIEQEYARMRSTLRKKIEDISENKSELMSNLNSLKSNDRYSQILELSDLLSMELYREREKAKALEKEEQLQMRLELEEVGETVKKGSARPAISPDRTAVKIESDKNNDLGIKVMDRSAEAVPRNEQKDDS